MKGALNGRILRACFCRLKIRRLLLSHSRNDELCAVEQMYRSKRVHARSIVSQQRLAGRAALAKVSADSALLVSSFDPCPPAKRKSCKDIYTRSKNAQTSRELVLHAFERLKDSLSQS